MAGESILKTFELQAKCSICLEHFVEPVILECGHNFCRHCIETYWKEFLVNKSCPHCKMGVKSGSFIPNRPLENVTALFKQLSDQAKEAEGGEKVCEIHREPLESFCMSDKDLVCSLCVTSVEHQGHNVIAAELAALDFKDYFSRCIADRRKRTGLILEHKSNAEQESQDLLKSVDKVKQVINAKFKELHQILSHREAFLMGRIHCVMKIIECKRDSHMNRLFWEISSDAWNVRKLGEKCCQPARQCLQDVKSTLDRFEKTSTFECPGPFSPKDKLPLWDLRDISVSLGQDMQLFKDILESELELQEAIVMLDLQTAHPRLILSEDCKSVRLGDKSQVLPKSPKRFDASFFVLGCEQFTTGRCYWDVIVGSKGDWAVGVARKSMWRKGQVSISSKSGIWAIGKQAGQYIFFDSPDCVHLVFKGELKRVRVSLNCVGRAVAFFDCEGGALLHQAMLTAAPKEIFLPFFHLGLNAVLSLSR